MNDVIQTTAALTLRKPAIREDENGFYFVLNGEVHGYWRDRPTAKVGLVVEMRRVGGVA